MDKLPKKEDLLPKQSPASQTLPSVGKGEEDVAVKKAKDQAEIASAENKKVEVEIKTKLAQQGYQSIEEGLKTIEQMKQDAQKMLQSAQEIEGSAVALKEEFEVEKEKAVHALEVLKERESLINSRLERAVRTEQTLQVQDNRYATAKQELQTLIEYHQSHIRPCVKSLRAVSQTIYTWIDLLNDTKYDFAPLYNYICKVTKHLDNYINNVPKSIRRDIIDLEGDNE